MHSATRLSGKLDPRYAASSVLAVKPVLIGFLLDCHTGTVRVSTDPLDGAARGGGQHPGIQQCSEGYSSNVHPHGVLHETQLFRVVSFPG
jgi:hypothetical protein